MKYIAWDLHTGLMRYIMISWRSYSRINHAVYMHGLYKIVWLNIECKQSLYSNESISARVEIANDMSKFYQHPSNTIPWRERFHQFTKKSQIAYGVFRVWDVWGVR